MIPHEMISAAWCAGRTWSEPIAYKKTAIAAQAPNRIAARTQICDHAEANGPGDGCGAAGTSLMVRV